MINNIKTTILFSGVQILSIILKLILNKAAAVFIGVDGFGVIGIIQSTLDMIKTFFAFGVPQGTTREVAKSLNSKSILNQTIINSKRITLILGVLAGIFTYIFSDLLSELSFGNSENSHLIKILSVIVFIVIVGDVNLAILRGMRRLKDLALATVFSAFVGTLVGTSTYYFFGYDGILGVFFAISISALFFSSYFLKKNYKPLNNQERKISINESRDIFKLGFFLMLIAFLGLLSEYITKSYIAVNYGLDAVGVYQVGLIVVSGYFGIFITAMMTDFYPKISNMHKDNEIIENELNKQVLSSLLLIGPLLLTFIFFQPLLIKILFSVEFLSSSKYVYFALFATLIIVVSNPVDIILLVKDEVKLLLLISVVYRVLGVLLSIFLYDSYGLYGLGCSYFIMSIFHLLIMQYAVSRLFGISLSRRVLKVLSVMLSLLMFSYITTRVEVGIFGMYTLQIILFIIMLFYCNHQFKRSAEISMLDLIRNRIKKSGA